MKRLLALSILFITSCGNSPQIDPPPPPSGSWSESIQSEMLEYLGEVLPYASFDESTLESEYTELTEDDYGVNGNNYTLTDDNETNVLEDYESKLLSAGFLKGKDELDFDCYTKSNSKGTLFVYFNWYPETTVLDVTAPAGNQIDAYLYC